MADAAVKEKPASAPEAERELTDGFHLIIDALKLNGIKTIYGVPGHSDHGFRAHGAGVGHPRPVVPARTECRLCRLDRRLPDQKPGICLTVSAPGVSQRPDRARARDDQLLPDDPDLGLVRTRDRRSAAGRLRGDGPTRHRQAAVQGGISACCMRKTSASAWRAPSAPRFRAVRAASISICRPSCSVRSWMRRPDKKSLVKVIDAAPAQIPAAERHQARARCAQERQEAC